ncbi:MFS transporter [Sphingomonas mali]|uniref:MFS transporter n=1 Tax=Sphingomonas mali TaxID=40682 RepID=UPI00082EF8D0|nr:MFS transporter [Sphingomonas mali]
MAASRIDRPNGSDVATARATARTGWRMVALATLAQNFALGLSFGSLGPLMKSFETEFHTGRGLVSTAAGLLFLALSILSPLLGARLNRVRLRYVMCLGGLLSALGYFGLTVVTGIYEVLAIYAFLIGPGICLLGYLPASTLVSNWFAGNRGKALGIVNMTIVLFFFPPILARVVDAEGMRAAFLVIAGLYLAASVLMLLVIDRPAGSGCAAGPAVAVRPAQLTTGAILHTRAFWALSLGVGILTGAGSTITVHIIPLATGRGFSLEASSLLLSAYAGAGLLGTVIFGALSDRIGSRTTLVINGVAQIALWLLLLPALGYVPLIVIVALIGICSVAILTLHSAAISEIFGQDNVAAVLGLSYVPKVVFIFGSAPLAGFLYDFTGGYDVAILVHIACFVFATLGFVLLPGRVTGSARR